MQIEVTEKEARDIYSRRYTRKKGWRLGVFLGVSVVIALIGNVLAIYFGIWVLLCAVVPLIIALYKIARLSQTSNKYARSQIKEQG